MEDIIFYDQSKTKEKTKTKTYKMKNVFEKSNIPQKDKNKVIAKVKKPMP